MAPVSPLPPGSRDPLAKLVIGTFFFLVFGTILGIHAQRAQAAGTRLSLGDLNATLPPEAGFALAGVMLVFGVIYAYRTRQLLRNRPPRP